MSSVLRTRQAVALAAAVCAGALAVGCGTVHASGAPPTVTITASATSPGTSPAGTPSPAAAAGGSCPTSALRLTLGPPSAGAGHFYRPVVFTNISGASCTLYGYPGISFVAAIGGTQLGVAAGRSPASKRLVVLAPGGKAHAVVDLLDVLNFPPSTCAPVTAHWLKVYPPNQFSAS
ncbi:MAG TPA: DUF4232 domain-containing protein, partial [Xanthobacteraceae bacterium]